MASAGVDVHPEVLACVAHHAEAVDGRVEVDPERRARESLGQLDPIRRRAGGGVDRVDPTLVAEPDERPGCRPEVDADQGGVAAQAGDPADGHGTAGSIGVGAGQRTVGGEDDRPQRPSPLGGGARGAPPPVVPLGGSTRQRGGEQGRRQRPRCQSGGELGTSSHHSFSCDQARATRSPRHRWRPGARVVRRPPAPHLSGADPHRGRRRPPARPATPAVTSDRTRSRPSRPSPDSPGVRRRAASLGGVESRRARRREPPGPGPARQMAPACRSGPAGGVTRPGPRPPGRPAPARDRP